MAIAIFFPETPLQLCGTGSGTRAAAGGTPALCCGTEAVRMGHNCGFNAPEKAMKRNTIDMLRLSPEASTANFPQTGTKRHFTRVLVGLKQL
jgi:hypothetical protein